MICAVRLHCNTAYISSVSPMKMQCNTVKYKIHGWFRDTLAVSVSLLLSHSHTNCLFIFRNALSQKCKFEVLQFM